MWRNYTAGTFTVKRKNTPTHHADCAASSSSQPNPLLARRASSSICSSLEDFIEADSDELKEQRRRRSSKAKEKNLQTAERPESQEEEEEGGNQHLLAIENNGIESAEVNGAAKEEERTTAQQHQQQNHSAASIASSSTSLDLPNHSSARLNAPAPPRRPKLHSPSFRARKPSSTNTKSPALNFANDNKRTVESSKQNNLLLPGGSEEETPEQQQQQQRRTSPTQRTTMPPVKDDSMTNNNNNNNRATTAMDGRPAPNMFERGNVHSDRPAPQMPTTDGIEYPRAASWSSSTVAEIMRDSIGRQVFRCFLHESLAEENLLFIEEIEKMKKEKQPEKIRHGVRHLLEKYGQYINLSSVAMSKLKEATKSEMPDPRALELAHKEIYKLLENDQFPRFRRSKLYLGFLEQLLPRSYAERWMTSFDALLGNQVGRHHFRQFLFSVHAEENLRFWESVIEFRQLKNKSMAMLNMGRTIQQQFLREGAHNEVFLPFGLRQRVEKKIREKDVDEMLFDDSVRHVEQILKNDPYVRFINSKEYNELLAKLH